MGWEAIGAIGEVVGALAVVATILYLATQVRMSNKAANHHDVHMDRIRERLLLLAQDEDLARIVAAAASGEEPDKTEAARAGVFASHRILIQRDAWQRARLLGEMPGLPKPERYLDILVEEMPVIPLFWYTAMDPCTERLQNFRPNPTQSGDTWNAAQWYLAPSSS